MDLRPITDQKKAHYDKLVTHIIQSWEWREFRKKAGLDLVRLGHFEGTKMVKAYQLTFHKVPVFSQNVGYFPKGPMPDDVMIKALSDLGA